MQYMRPFLTQPTALQAPDSDLRHCRALIIDSNITSGSVLRSMLADLGLTGVVLARKVSEARRALESRQFDVVLCDFHFDDCGMTGSDLLDDLRRAQLLPYSTVFVMVTGEASYEKVAEAAESALDSYLLKPHTANALAQRLHLARHRKVVLGSIFEAIEAKDFEAAAHLCLRRIKERGEYWLYAARMGGELLMRLNRFEEATKLFQLLEKDKSLPWARLGVARAQLDSGQTQPARRTLESLIASSPSYTEAYDVMARAQLQAGLFDEALDAYQKAADATPASIARLQKLGMLAFYLGKNHESARALERATSLGLSSKMFDAQGLVTLAQIRFDEQDLKGVQRCDRHLINVLEKEPGSMRLRRMQHFVHILSRMLQQQNEEVLGLLMPLAEEASLPDFDLEAACNLLSVWVRVHASGLQVPDVEEQIQKVALRFCASKAHTDMLTMAVRTHEPYAELVQQSYKRVLEMAEKAMAHVRQGTMDPALQTLMTYGKQTSNAKLLDLADMLLTRHGTDITSAHEKAVELKNLRDNFCRFSPHVQLGAGTGRNAGSLKLRTG